ncbi:MAG: ferrichrome ABC transporter permease, partial [Chloroflexi bacterium]|nr:ferrichrome ABC transporter permease [Chloroflexota bacterium]
MSQFYALSILLSAFLLFLVQPMVGKFILPWFGGTPTVWSTVLLFFQVALTGGYAYAYWLLGQWRNRQQGMVHLALLGLSLALLLFAALAWPSPLTPDASWRPQGNDLPILGILKILAVSVGIPYFLLSSNSTLVQAWFSGEYRDRVPYRLYVLSNVGSLLALISYPILFEPNLTVRTQAWLWTIGYVAFAFSAAYLAWRTYHRAPDVAAQRDKNTPSTEERPGKGTYILWLGLAACASTLLISVTSQITQEVAVIPFLWVLPLALYLLSFILAFSGRRWYSRSLYWIAFFILSFVSVWMLVKWPPFSMVTQIALYALLLFTGCMACHGELYKLRPHPRFLPSFYLMIALGGALGGIYVNLLAPYLFSSGFWELQWGLVACGIFLALVLQSERAPLRAKQAGRAQRRRATKARQAEQPRRWSVRPVVVVMAIVVVLLSTATVLIMRAISADALLAMRSFYGVSRVWEINSERPEWRAYQLTHGKTVHGFQFVRSELRAVPTTFYAESSGVGLAFLNHPARPGVLSVGALGLGIGVIASYGQAGDTFRFY